MKVVSGMREKRDKDLAQIKKGLQEANLMEAEVTVRGAVHSIRDMGEFLFLVLRRYDGILQCVAEKTGENTLPELREGMTVEVSGRVRQEERAPGGIELAAEGIRLLSQPEPDSAMPLPIGKRKLSASLEKRLSLRPVELRNLEERAVFRIQEGLVRGFREFLHQQHFTEIRTPKLVAGNAEGGSDSGGANVFRLEYFGKRAFLAQSPQFYKQMLVGVYDRVFEVAPVFRAEKHNTIRHLNEYTSMDLELGYLDCFEELMELEQAMLAFTMDLLRKEYARELSLLQVKLPDVSRIPAVRFEEAKRLVSERYGRPMKAPYDLEPEEEHLIGRYIKEEYGSDLVFVTHYPSKKRPFYTMDDPEDSRLTLSFDLLFGGMEITTGGQRIHDYRQQVEKLIARGMNPEEFADYLMAHQNGLPPHGGLGIGLERLTMKLLRRENVRETTMFPRDVTRLRP